MGGVAGGVRGRTTLRTTAANHPRTHRLQRIGGNGQQRGHTRLTVSGRQGRSGGPLGGVVWSEWTARPVSWAAPKASLSRRAVILVHAGTASPPSEFRQHCLAKVRVIFVAHKR